MVAEASCEWVVGDIGTKLPRSYAGKRGSATERDAPSDARSLVAAAWPRLPADTRHGILVAVLEALRGDRVKPTPAVAPMRAESRHANFNG